MAMKQTFQGLQWIYGDFRRRIISFAMGSVVEHVIQQRHLSVIEKDAASISQKGSGAQVVRVSGSKVGHRQQ